MLRNWLQCSFMQWKDPMDPMFITLPISLKWYNETFHTCLLLSFEVEAWRGGGWTGWRPCASKEWNHNNVMLQLDAFCIVKLLAHAA